MYVKHKISYTSLNFEMYEIIQILPLSPKQKRPDTNVSGRYYELI